MIDIFFTIAIPAYKALFLEEAIRSILNQSYKSFELVIVDDCSHENLGKIVSKFGDSRIRYYRNEKGFGAEHVVGNWNRCLEYSKGDYFICMGDDDKLKPDCLQNLADLINKYPDVDVCYSRTELIDEYSNVITVLDYRKERESVYEMIWNRWNGGSMFVGNYCYKTSGLKDRGGFYDLPYAWGADAISAYEAAMATGIANTSDVGFQYRKNIHSISSSSQNIEGKVNAIQKEKMWFQNFFQNEADNEKDQMILEKLRTGFDRHFVHMLSAEIIYGMKENLFNQLMYWVKHRDMTGLTYWQLVKCFIHACKNR